MSGSAVRADRRAGRVSITKSSLWTMAPTITPWRGSQLGPRIRVLRFEKNAGQSAAMYAGLRRARGADGGSDRWRFAERSGRYSEVAGGDRTRRRSGLRLSSATEGYVGQADHESSRQFCPQPIHEGRGSRYGMHA